ncbi:MAG TPA: mercury methylation corrinoid protein HgcA [Deltaproteobacteria bacterium]|nr:mercury methylation corrinoid protein HgcA [Deltaproteobacteria bacterium]
MASASACCSQEADNPRPPRLDQPFVEGAWEGPWGKAPQVSSILRREDHWGTVKARWGFRRMSYTVDPGLYALGKPDDSSPVLVTANYKMSFDRLREALPERDAWILVLDTKGVNVWCAAGKGTFGTGELLRRMEASRLKEVVKHRSLILPQLGAPGVEAHFVKAISGFRVLYGPVSARDLPAYLDAGMKATPEMRRKNFPVGERAALIPIELVAALKAAFIAIPVLFFISAFTGREGLLGNMSTDGVFSIASILGAVIAGTVLFPLLLPYLPGRAFSTKGFIIGILTAGVLLFLWGYDLHSPGGLIGAIAWLLMISSVSACLAMNFTGSSTYTSLSGVKREMRWALPFEIGTALSGFGLWIVSRFMV